MISSKSMIEHSNRALSKIKLSVTESDENVGDGMVKLLIYFDGTLGAWAIVPKTKDQMTVNDIPKDWTFVDS